MTHPSREFCRPALTTDADVAAMWGARMCSTGWPEPRIYVVLVDADRLPAPVILEIVDIPGRHTADDARILMRIYAHLLEEQAPHGSVAVLVCRPGSAQLTDDDRTGCRYLYEAGREEKVSLEVVHIGTDTAIVPAPMTEVLTPRSREPADEP